jgi:hypothetical protein
MKIKFLIGFVVLGLSLASAKSFQISVDSVAKAGDVQLQPGIYKVTLNGNKVKFTSEASGKSVETNATVDTSSKKKFDSTAVESVQGSGSSKISGIDLGGTTTKIKFE